MPVPESPESRGPGRRAVLAFAGGAIVVGSLPLALLRRRRLHRRRLPVMGTLADVAVLHDDPARARRALDAAFAALIGVDRTMSRFRADSEVGRANRAAFAGPVTVGPETAAVLEAALAWAEATDGAFDPCLGRACALWNVDQRRAPPAPGAVAALARRWLYTALELRSAAGGARVRFADPDVALDLGGIAKGHAVDLAVEALRRQGVTAAFVNAGGDLYALGRSPDGDRWRVGVRDPSDPARTTATLEVEDGAVATSGDYEQGFVSGGKRYSHLLDPDTGAPWTTGRHSLTVCADRCVTADAAATALFGMEPAPAGALLRVLAPDARLAS